MEKEEALMGTPVRYYPYFGDKIVLQSYANRELGVIETQIISNPKEIEGKWCVQVAMVAKWVPVALLEKMGI